MTQNVDEGGLITNHLLWWNFTIFKVNFDNQLKSTKINKQQWWCITEAMTRVLTTKVKG